MAVRQEHLQLFAGFKGVAKQAGDHLRVRWPPIFESRCGFISPYAIPDPEMELNIEWQDVSSDLKNVLNISHLH